MPARKAAERRVKRPNLSRWVRLLIRDVALTLPEFRHVKADGILVVCGEARRASRATIRPTRFQETRTLRSKDGKLRKPRLTFRGRKILYVITLRPLFFRSGGAENRIETILHELFHLSPKFDGTLDATRRHEAMGAAFEEQLRPLVKRYLARCSDSVLERFAFHGEVMVRQWLEKPPRALKIVTRQRRHYDESQTFLAPVKMITRSTKH